MRADVDGVARDVHHWRGGVSHRLEGGGVVDSHLVAHVDGRLDGTRDADLHVPARTELANRIGSGSERQTGAVVESDLAVRARRQALLSLPGDRDVVATTLHRRSFAEGTLRRERPDDAPHDGALSSTHRIGVHIEDARAVAETDEGADDGGVVVEEDSAAQDETAIRDTGTQVGARSGGVVEAATFLRPDLAMRNLRRGGGTEGDDEEQCDGDYPTRTPGFARMGPFHDFPLCGWLRLHPSCHRRAGLRGNGPLRPRSVMRDFQVSMSRNPLEPRAETLRRPEDSSQVISVRGVASLTKS